MSAVSSSGHFYAASVVTGVVYAVAFSPKGDRIVTASWDRTARLWIAGTFDQALIDWGHRLLGTGEVAKR
jgi:WD40 repeat protein